MESHATTKREWYQIVHKLIYLCGSDENLIWEKIIAKGTDTWLREGGEGYVNENGNETMSEV